MIDECLSLGLQRPSEGGASGGGLAFSIVLNVLLVGVVAFLALKLYGGGKRSDRAQTGPVFVGSQQTSTMPSAFSPYQAPIQTPMRG